MWLCASKNQQGTKYNIFFLKESQSIINSCISQSFLTCMIQSIATSDMNLSAAIAGSQPLVLHKDSQPTLASTSAGHRENWGETNMADASPRTDTSTDDTEDKIQRVIILLSYCFLVMPPSYDMTSRIIFPSNC